MQAALSLQHQADARVTAVEKKCERATGLAEGHSKRIEQLSNDIGMLRRERDTLRNELATERDARQDLNVLVSRFRAENTSLEKDAGELRSQRESLSENLGRLEANLTSMRNECDQLKEGLSAKQEALATTKLNLENERKFSARLGQENQSQQETITSIGANYQDLQSRYENERSALAAAKEGLASVRTQLSSAVAKNTVLKEERYRLLSEITLLWDTLSQDSRQ